jgi:hypothetical protein
VSSDPVNIGRIGKKADEDDMRGINAGVSNLEVNKAGNHFEDELPLLDKAGNRIGSVGMVFNFKDETRRTSSPRSLRRSVMK